MYSTRSARRWAISSSISGCILGCALTAITAAPAMAETGPIETSAVYRIKFAGIEIGKYNFRSTQNGKFYAADSSAKLSLMLGAFKWSGATKSSGNVAGDAVKPQVYDYEYQGNKKSGSVKLGFSQIGVNKITVLPAKPPSPEAVPVTEQHLRDVVDPMSAALALTRGAAGNPCTRKLQIFDGRQRFDLALSFRGQKKVEERQPSGQPNTSFVCAVRYVPIAGHKPDKDETKNFAANGDIEIALRPVPSANLMVPHHVVIPSAWGTATMELERIDITTPGNKIALVH